MAREPRPETVLKWVMKVIESYEMDTGDPIESLLKALREEIVARAMVGK